MDMRRILAVFAVVVLGWQAVPQTQANGKLQIHFMDVGQGDGAVLISPQGEIVLFDDGVRNNCDLPVSYLQQLGIDHIDYHILSHYHADHLGCATQVFSEFPLRKDAFDRGSSYPSQAYTSYISAIGTHRVSLAAPGRQIVLDSTSTTPVTITVVALNGNGIATSNENDLSLVAVVAYGTFRAEIGGDLSGESVVQHFGPTAVQYSDIESSVAPLVGRIAVYKVHHHCSAHSSNDAWLAETKPVIGIVSAGDNNTYGHPDPTCLERLHKAGVKTYWTETGKGGTPDPGFDVVAGNIVVEVAAAATSFTVAHGAAPVDTYSISSAGPGTTDQPRFAWSKKSAVYHKIDCKFVLNISPANLEKGNAPPPGKRLHTDCPR
jgi:beta-lactamase superfamily II metal-dependent hydrolase